ncbi:MAG: universal stress protein [Chloroflexi bacterium]|nr:universal stress protein [Chloroflexota bacterium]
MSKKLLVPLDGTPESAVALPPARAIAKATGAAITLLRVIPLASLGRRGPNRTDVADYLGRVAGELEQADVSVSTVIREGAVADEILNEVRERDHALVAMATHGRSGADLMLIGSVAHDVVARSPAPVLLLKPGGRRVTRIRTLLVPVDGTPGGALALGTAVALAHPTSAKIVLIEVTIPIPGYTYGNVPLESLFIDPSWNEDALASAQTYVDGLATKLRRAGLDAEGRTQMGQVVPSIAEVAATVDADLIVMSTHALTGPARTVLGSVADELVRMGERPVLLIRRDTHHLAGDIVEPPVSQ